MTSIVDKYYRIIIQNIDNVRMKFDISTLLVKCKEHDSKINDIENDISDNLELINTNKSDISDNLELINTNKSDISDNLELVNTNKSNISDNLELVNTNKSNISDNLEFINANKNNITNNYNITQIYKKKSDFNTTLSDNNKNNISNNLELINTNKSDISKILELLKNKIPQNTFNKVFDIENKNFKFNRSTHFFEIFSTDIENDFITDGELRISSKIYYKYKNLSNDVTRLCHESQLYCKDGLIHTLIFSHRFFAEPDFKNNILYVKEDFYIKLLDTYSKLKLILMLHRVNRNGIGTIDLQTYNNNSINVSFIENPII